MVEKEKINKICSAISKRKQITEELLTKYDISEKETKELIKAGILSEPIDGEYKFLSVSTLKSYGVDLMNDNITDRAIECFLICYEIEPSNREIIISLLIAYIRRRKYQEAFETFDILDKTEDGTLKKDNNIYLYLLSIFTNYPKKYRERIMNLTYDDITIGSSDFDKYQDIANQNKMRILILQNKLSKAYKLFNTVLCHNYECHTEITLIRLLLANAIEAEERKISVLLSYTERKDYTGIINFIEKKRTTNKISLYYGYIYYLAKQILTIHKTRRIPTIKITDTNSLKEALIGNNFSLALQLNQERQSQVTEKPERNIVTILLKEINALIYKISQEENNKNNIINTIIGLLKESKEKEALKLIKEYLKSKNKSSYEQIVLNLIKIDYFEKNQNFSNTKEFLTSILNQEDEQNIENYIHKCNISIEENNFDIASSYLYIILRFISLSKSLEQNKKLEEKINNLKQKLNHQQQVRTQLLSFLKMSKDPSDPTIVLGKLSDQEYSLIVKMLPSIENLSIIYNNIDEKKIILRETSSNDSDIDISSLFKDGQTAYFEGEYQKSIDINSQIIRIAENPKLKTYVAIGLSYLKLGNKEQAIKYFTIAEKINVSGSGRRYKCNKIITALQENNPNPEELSLLIEKIEQSIKEYDMNQLEEIAYYIKENKLSEEEAKTQFQLDQDQINLIKLIYARDYYVEEDYFNGDKLYKEVSKSKNKGPKVISMLEELRVNKIFYKNRKEKYQRKLHQV